MNEEKRAALAAFLADNSGSINDLEKQFWSQFAGLFDLNGGGLDASSITSGTIDAARLPQLPIVYKGLFTEAPPATGYPNGVFAIFTGFTYNPFPPYEYLDTNPRLFITHEGKWLPASGESVFSSVDYPQVLVGRATLNNGASNNITLATALPRVYDQGIWVYGQRSDGSDLFGGQDYPYVFVKMSSTTTGTIYQNGPGSAPYTVTGGPISFGCDDNFWGLGTEIYLPEGFLSTLVSMDAVASVRFPANTDSKIISLMVDHNSSPQVTFNTVGNSSALFEIFVKGQGTADGAYKSAMSRVCYGSTMQQDRADGGGNLANGGAASLWCKTNNNSWIMLEDLTLRVRSA